MNIDSFVVVVFIPFHFCLHCAAVCETECVHGICTGVNTCTCDFGYTGQDCNNPGELHLNFTST